MQEQKVAQTFTEKVPEGTDDTDVRQCCDKDVADTNRAVPESTEEIYRSMFGDVS